MDNLPAQSSFASKRFHAALCGLLLTLLPVLANATATQDIGAIRKAVDNFAQQNTAGQPGKVELTVGAIDPRLRLPACDAPEVFLPTGSRLWGNTTVGVRCQSATPWTIYVPVSVKVMAQVVVAAHPLSSGQTVSQSDVLQQNSDLSQLPPGVIFDPALAIGKTVISGASSGQALRQDMLRAPQVIQRGQTVKLVAKGSGFQVSSEGKALANATLGQAVSVRTQSGQVINGIAKQNGIVEVNF
ncbi:MAG TPA: flagellar basal body P-ring formation chaperone FlgA [Sulfuricella sp.]|nr:flagellar basal body P-ring formation chaperone FlgA [Sulfuricella sp.]